MENLLARIKRGETLISDGAMGTLLMERGLEPGEPPESLTLKNPEVLEEVARLYLDAGADILHTNTFGGSPLRLKTSGLEDRTEEINRIAIEAAKRGAAKKAYISASCGPSGKILKPYGDTDPDTIYKSFERQMRAFSEEPPDIICIETMMDLEEACLAIRAARTILPDTPIIASMTFNPTHRGFFTTMGVSIEKAAEGLARAGADIIGSNCGNGIENMIKIAADFRQCTKLPLIIQSNAGLPKTIKGKPVYSETPEFMAGKSVQLMHTGVSIIGGCCGTTPEHIRSIRKALAVF